MDGDLTEGHLTAICGVTLDVQSFSPWLTTQQAWEELAAKAVYDKGKNGDKSVRAVREDVQRWKEGAPKACPPAKINRFLLDPYTRKGVQR